MKTSTFGSFRKFPHYKQIDQMDCGATCLRMIFKYYEINVPIQRIRKLCQTTNTGVNLLGISEAAEKFGFRTYGANLSIDQLSDIELPCIVHWNQDHFVVLYKISNKNYYVADPASGLVVFHENDFGDHWFPSKDIRTGLSLILSPGPFNFESSKDNSGTLNWSNILHYFFRYKRLFAQVALGLIVGSIIQLIYPFLTQSIVDIGIKAKDINFINLVLIGQLMLFIAEISTSFIRSWILLHISTRINISVLTDFLIKIMKLPMSFFDIKTHGDLMQRMEDQQRIESFLTGNTLNTLFSLFNMLLFGGILFFYDKNIFAVFIFASFLYTLWILLFMGYRRRLDNKRFEISAENQNYMVEILQNIKDIKLNNAERIKRWGWEKIQAKLFKFKIRSLSVDQFQSIGSAAINQAKSILIIFLSAKSVLDGDLTLGGMMAIQYIVGMINSPVEQLLGFLHSYQDAKMSLERINEVYESEEEEDVNKEYLTTVPLEKSIEIKNLFFTYYGAGNSPIFEDLNLKFPMGETTAIVGTSGSGKTTILKLLMRFYAVDKGEIRVGGVNLNDISFSVWRGKCGSVLQENVIFSDTIAKNIAVGEEQPNQYLIEEAIKIANLEDYISQLPFGIETKIGNAGKGLSQGQKQRLLIARAVYKQPDYLFLDEATNALDANNEKKIIENFNNYFKGKTVVIVAHRLSTVKNAHNIILLENGKIVEEGNHKELTALKGKYFELVRNQLELGT